MDKLSALNFRNPVALAKGLGERLRGLRLARGWTQEELSERAGVALSTLKLLESKGQGSLQRLIRIAGILGADGELRELFATPSSFESIEAARRMDRKRAPRRRKDSGGA
ncbi:MAG: putative DNA-binding protein [Akkermansiaceae bacterium]|nr:putative DNA-binding protein [Akkermansiaceae bacterium]